MKGQINLIYIGILTLISLAIFGTVVIWNFSITESSVGEVSEKQMDIIANQVLEDINFLSTYDSKSVYKIKKNLPDSINNDDYCVRLYQDDSGSKRIYVTKSGNTFSYTSFKKTDIYIDVTNKEIDFENSISCGNEINIIRNDTVISITNSGNAIPATVVDSPPVISTIADTSTNEDVSKEINFTVSDENLATLSLTVISGNTDLVNSSGNGGLTIPSASVSSRNLTITPNSNLNGLVEINITATDNIGQTDVESFNLTVNAVDDGPTTPTVLYSPSSNRKVGDSLSCVASSTDPEGDSITYSYQFRNGSTSGNIIQSFSSDNTIDSVSATYAHETIYCIAYATSNSIDSANGNAGITISNTDPSSAALSSNTIAEGSSAGTAVGAITCTDVDNDVCSYTEYAPGHNGSSIFEISGTSIVLSSGQNLDFETDNSYNYSALVDDGFGGDIYQEFNISVTDINEVPTDITPNSLTINENSANGASVGSLSTTDQDSGDSHSYTERSDGTGEAYFNISNSGAVDVQDNSILNYESGTTSYTYEVETKDTGNLIYRENITITILDVNEAVITAPDSYSVNENTTLTKSSSAGVLGNDTDPESGTITATLVNDVASGSLGLTTNGSFTYIPPENFTGVVEFNYSASDGSSSSLPENVTITISTPSNNAPVSSGDTASVNEDTTLSDTFTASDADGDGLTYTIITNGKNGTASITNSVTGAFNYVPNSNYFGTDLLAFRVNDGTVNSNIATFNITINSVNDAPTLSGIPDINLDQGNVNFLDVWPYHADVDGSDAASTYSVVSFPISAEFSCSVGANQYVNCGYAIGPCAAGQVFTVTVVADDGQGGAASDDFDVSITCTGLGGGGSEGGEFGEGPEDPGGP